MDGSSFFGRASLLVLFGTVFSKAVQDFLALVTISSRNFPVLLRALSLSRVGTVRNTGPAKAGSFQRFQQRARHPPPFAPHEMHRKWRLPSGDWQPGGHHGDEWTEEYRPSFWCCRPGFQGRRTYGHGYTGALRNFQIPERVFYARHTATFFRLLNAVPYKDMKIPFFVEMRILFYGRELAAADGLHGPGWDPEKVNHGEIAVRRERQVTPSLSDRSINPTVIITNQRKETFREKQDSK